MSAPARRPAAGGALLVLFLVALPGCAQTALAPALVDYRARPAALVVGDFPADRPDAARSTSGTYYNLKTEEGRRAAEAAAASGPREQPLCFTIAYNVALRLADHEGAMRGAGLAPPPVLVVGEDGRIWRATGSRYGDAFVRATEGEAAAMEQAPRAAGHLREERGAPGGWRAGLTIEQGGRIDAADLAYLAPGEASQVGQPGLTDDARGQLIARLADLLAPHEVKLTPRGTPLGLVRAVEGGGAIAVDLGLERVRLTVAEVDEVFDPPLPESPSRSELESVLLGRYVRIEYADGPRAPRHPTWLRVRVKEPAP